MATQQENSSNSALAHLRVLDLTGPGAQYAGRLMADLGADVVLIEPPGGQSGRGLKPFAGDTADGERSIHHLVFNLNKRSVTLDLDSEEGREAFRTLAATADILLDDGSSFDLDGLGLGYEALRATNPGLVFTSITPFGHEGPYSEYADGEMITQAIGGMMYGFGDPDAAPVAAPLRQGYQLAGQHAAWASLTALRYRRESGHGQYIEVSVQEVLGNILAYFGRYASRNQINRRPGSTTALAPTNNYPATDGVIYMQPGYPRHIEALFDWIGDETLKDEVWQDQEFRRENGDVLTSIISEFSAKFSKLEFAREAQKRHIPTSPVMTIDDLVVDEHLKAREFFVGVDHPVAGRYESPSGPFRMGESPWRVYRPAPLLGQHTEEVAAEWAEARQAASATPTPAGGSNGTEPPLPLKGLRVLDLSRVWAGPYMTRYFAELGADILKVESEMLPDRAQAVGAFSFNFAEINRGKRSITLNFAKEEAIEVFLKLVKESDVVLENFRSGVLQNWGLTFERMQEANPKIIYLSMPGMGNSGPASDQLSYGQSLLAYTGIMSLWAREESPGITRPKVPLPDFIGAATGAFAVLSALEQRDQTGKGQMIEMAQVEGLVATMGVAFLDYSLNGRIWGPEGNFDPNAAPHEAFQCLGHDAWVAIACYSDVQWQAMGTAMDSPDWAADATFATLEGRLANIEELNAKVSGWTGELTPRQVQRALQGAGVPAGVVASAEDIYWDVNLRARDYILTVDHRPLYEVLEHPGATVRFTETPSRVVGPVVPMGNDNMDVFTEVAGLSRGEVERLQREQVIY